MERGLDALKDPQALEAFRLANRAMAVSGRRRLGQILDKDPATLDPPRWRPFQLAFVLMNLRGLADPTSARPGGGGPPLLPDRRRQDRGVSRAGGLHAGSPSAAASRASRRLGCRVLMRYTLRLLTLDQLVARRDARCARWSWSGEKDRDRLGTWPFEIGLWVGQAATPNRMGRQGDPQRDTARRPDDRLPE